ncbi:MAG: flagellar export chaperone FliS [candidate division Zixibacteria bacterium]|nr:flagellar export chaperone FliS [candidate division Zixibacteria bacterium]
MNNRLEAYRYADTMGKSPLDLIITVYDGAIKALRTAAEHYNNKKNQNGYDEIQKAKRMITHLYSTLDTERGGQVAANLGKMYSWAIAQLSVTEATKDIEQIEAVAAALNNLRSGWVELKARQGVATKAAAGAPEATLDRETAEHVLTTA